MWLARSFDLACLTVGVPCMVFLVGNYLWEFMIWMKKTHLLYLELI